MVAKVSEITENTPVEATPLVVTGETIVNRRRLLGLSREAFAALIGVRTGAVWRMEVKNNFKPEEREHLLTIADTWLTNAALQTPRRILQGTKPTTLKVPTRKVATSPQRRVPTHVEADDDLVQWVDTEPIDRKRVLEIVFPVESASPTALSQLDGRRRISNSEVQTFKRCRRKWWLGYYRGLSPVVTQAHGPLATGTRIHLALAAWYRPTSEERVDPRDALEVIIENDRVNLRASLESTPIPDETAMEQFNKSAELERVMVAGYVDWIHENGMDADYEVTGSEQYLEVPLPELENTLLIGRLDARVIRRFDRARLFIDHKTVASIEGAIRLLPMSEQMMWYLLLESSQPDHDPDQRVAGALYNMIRKTKRTATARPPFYSRVESHYSPIVIESFRKRLVGVLDDVKYCRDELAVGEQSHQLIVYPTPTRDCSWDCPFFKVCTMADDGSRFEDALADHYTVGDAYAYYRKTSENGVEA
jgi:hypothetical protein